MKPSDDHFEMPSNAPDLNVVAYVRPVSEDEESGYVVCSADGTELAIFATRDAAYYAARQHNLQPVFLH